MPQNYDFPYQARLFILVVSRAVVFNSVTLAMERDIVHTIRHITCVYLSKCICSQIYTDTFKTTVSLNKLYTFNPHTFCSFLFSVPYCCFLPSLHQSILLNSFYTQRVATNSLKTTVSRTMIEPIPTSSVTCKAHTIHTSHMHVHMPYIDISHTS